MAAKPAKIDDFGPFFTATPRLTVLVEEHRDTAHQPAEQPAGIVCRKCGCADLRVFKTRRNNGGRIRRERICRHCGNRVITIEREAFSGH